MTVEKKLVLKLKNISFSYKKNNNQSKKVLKLKETDYALKDINLEFYHGEYIVIIGHNGSGKSTLSKIISGILIDQYDGEMFLFDQLVTIKNLKDLRKKIGIVFQNPDNQFIGSTARDDIAFGLENKCIEPKLINQEIEKISKKLRIDDYLDSEPLSLSGGQKQKVAIASVLVLNPEIILLDEEKSMLDQKGIKEVTEIINQLKSTREKTIISITHDMNEIMNADKVVVMFKGEVVLFDKPENILKKVDYLREINLDIPFVLQLIEGLKENGFNIKPTLNEDDLVDQIINVNKI
jgi:energy-coupling factor transport system ATP-binding protein